ncbi:MAG: PIN domain-containing protein [Elusimicrobia bacterium]|nr:PIN domain-containing protein [Elusimicrobiota bacterium]
MKKIKYYLETSVFNFVFADDEPAKKKVTEQFFKHWNNIDGEMYISEVVTKEIERAPSDKREKLFALIEKCKPSLIYLDKEVEAVAEKYIQEGIIPLKYRDDALHIAVAVVNDLDVVVSWNLRHIVKLKTKLGVEGVSRLLGYHEIEITTPEEVL